MGFELKIYKNVTKSILIMILLMGIQLVQKENEGSVLLINAYNVSKELPLRFGMLKMELYWTHQR